MYKRHLSMLHLFTIILLLEYIGAQDLTGNGLFTAQSTANAVDNSNLQARLSAYYQSMQSSPFRAANANLPSQSGYNYITPASTYAGYTTTKHATQTAPLAISVHPDDYTKFDKTEEAYFIPKPKSLTPNSNTNNQPSFYVPRTGASRSRARVQNIETANASEGVSSAQSEKAQTPVEFIQYQSELSRSQQLRGAQQNWRPLLRQQNSENPLSPQAVSNPVSTHQSEDFYEYNQQEKNNNAKDLTLDCQNHAGNSEIYETVPRPTNHIQNQASSQAALILRQKIPSTVDTPIFPLTGEGSRNFPTSSSVHSVNQRRLNIIRSLLAEYLALTQSIVPSEKRSNQLSAYNDEVAQSVADNSNKFSDEAQVSQLPAYSSKELLSPAANKFIEADQYQRQQYYQTRSAIPTIRQPHALYGAPFGDRLNPVSAQRNGEQS